MSFVHFEGFLAKQAGATSRKGLFKNWKRRYFILHDTSLKYYESRDSTTPLGELDLFGYEVNELDKAGARNFMFELRHPEKRDLLCQADNAANRTAWLEVLRQACDKDLQRSIELILQYRELFQGEMCEVFLRGLQSQWSSINVDLQLNDLFSRVPDYGPEAMEDAIAVCAEAKVFDTQAVFRVLANPDQTPEDVANEMIAAEELADAGVNVPAEQLQGLDEPTAESPPPAAPESVSEDDVEPIQDEHGDSTASSERAESAEGAGRQAQAASLSSALAESQVRRRTVRSTVASRQDAGLRPQRAPRREEEGLEELSPTYQEQVVVHSSPDLAKLLFSFRNDNTSADDAMFIVKARTLFDADETVKLYNMFAELSENGKLDRSGFRRLLERLEQDVCGQDGLFRSALQRAPALQPLVSEWQRVRYSSENSRSSVGEHVDIAELLFNVFDVDGDGSLNFGEVAAGLSLLCRASLRHRAKLLFAMADVDGGGMIRVEFWAALCAAVAETLELTGESGIQPSSVASAVSAQLESVTVQGAVNSHALARALLSSRQMTVILVAYFGAFGLFDEVV